MKIKICGMAQPSNIEQVARLKPDMMGFIFYEKSKRYIGKLDPSMINNQLFSNIKKVGVFVNAKLSTVFALVDTYGLDMVQLHGNETPEYCDAIFSSQIRVIKAFGIEPGFDFQQLANYQGACNYTLFDTKIGNQSGGTGQKFNWEIIQNYTLATPFLLSGGIGPNDAENVLKFHHPKFWGIDINSKFEDAPAFKNISNLEIFMQKIRTHAE